mmetsp:Transcript_7805/g.15243  ORF Transcript_7805/g.15243 Transcript_7805/m.15243 type:complete len:103 (+) Transcript_7805:170-478(+)
MAVETMTQEEYYAMGKDKPLPDDGPTFALLAILLSVAMWAYEGGWVAGALGKAWSGFPTLLTALQLGAGLAMMLPVIFSMTTMLVVVCAWVSTERFPKKRVC